MIKDEDLKQVIDYSLGQKEGRMDTADTRKSILHL